MTRSKKVICGSLLVSSMLFGGGDIEIPFQETTMEETSAWAFELEPYLMITNIDGDAKFGRLPTTSLNVDFSTILDNLDLAGMVHTEAHHKSGWGLWMDYGFMDLSNDVAPVDQISSARVRQGVLEVMGLYRKPMANGYIEYLAGMRWWDNDYDIGYALPNLGQSGKISRNVDWIDAVVGARYTYVVDENWKLRVHGDIGAGGADFTASTTAGFVYTVNDLIDVDVKYKATWVDYTEGTRGQRDYFVYDTVTHGLVVGVNFKF